MRKRTRDESRKDIRNPSCEILAGGEHLASGMIETDVKDAVFVPNGRANRVLRGQFPNLSGAFGEIAVATAGDEIALIRAKGGAFGSNLVRQREAEVSGAAIVNAGLTASQDNEPLSAGSENSVRDLLSKVERREPVRTGRQLEAADSVFLPDEQTGAIVAQGKPGKIIRELRDS